MDAGLSRWLLGLGNSNVAARANVPPLRDHERPSRNQRPQQSSGPRPLRSGAFTMQQSRQPPFNPTGWHACCNHWNAPCHSAPDKGKVS